MKEGTSSTERLSLSFSRSPCLRRMTEKGVNQFIRATWVAVQSAREGGRAKGAWPQTAFSHSQLPTALSFIWSTSMGPTPPSWCQSHQGGVVPWFTTRVPSLPPPLLIQVEMCLVGQKWAKNPLSLLGGTIIRTFSEGNF